MLKAKPFLCIDFGAGNLKLAEFEPNEGGTLRLRSFAIKNLGMEGSQEATREGAIRLQELLGSKQFSASRINVCCPGFQVFSKFVKLPPVESGKVTEIIQYEAQQNVPFPLEEVVWNYQILGTASGGELEVLLVAIKQEVVEGLLRLSEAAGLDLQLVDVSAAALSNSFRFNYADLEGCSMLLDIGAKTSNLLFFEKGKMYSRSINIGANSITQDFATESKLAFPDAEKLKIEEGFVSLGGAYEEPNSPQQALLSKIARQVMTRLHIQMNQTIQFYRGQQGGSVPERLFLAGGASLMPYTAQFFAEKLNVSVDYFNPFRNIQIDQAVNLEELARVAHTLGEVVGLGIRNLAQCPVELNLMPASHIKRQELGQKNPYFIAAVFSVVLVVFAFGWFYSWVAAERKTLIDDLEKQLKPLNDAAEEINKASAEMLATQEHTTLYEDLLNSRAYWAEVIGGIQKIFTQIESNPPKADPAAAAGGTTNDVPAGVWIERMDAVLDTGPAAAAVNNPRQPMMTAAPAAAAAPTGVNFLNLTCRALNMTRVKPEANQEFIFALQNAFKTNALFEPAGTTLTNRIEQVDVAAHTFSFAVTLQLKRPIKF